MSPVRRRAVRALRRKWLIPAALAAALALLAGLWFLLRKAPAELPPQPTAVSSTLWDRPVGTLLRLEIDNPFDAPYALVREDGEWQMEGQPGFVFRSSLLEDMVNNACLIITEDTVGSRTEHPEWQLENFGLGNGCVRVTAAFADGSAIAFRIGDPVPQEIPAYYFLLEGNDAVYIISADVYDAYTYTRMALHDVRNPALNGEVIDRIAFTGSDPFTAERRADGWYLAAPVCYPLSDTAMETLLDKLENLRFAQFAATEEEADLAACGLQPPARTLTLDIAETVVTGYDENGGITGETAVPAYQLRLDLGSLDGDTAFYCLYRGEVLKATVFTAGFLRTQSWETLLSTAPFNAPTNDLQRLTVEQDGQKTVYALSLVERVLPNNAFETDEDGNVIYDVTVTRNGERADSDRFLSAYRELLSLRAAARLPADYALPDTAPLLRITAERSQSTREVALYPLDALHYAIAVNGTALFQAERGWAESIVWP